MKLMISSSWLYDALEQKNTHQSQSTFKNFNKQIVNKKCEKINKFPSQNAFIWT